jgi:hypothetical protein
VGHRWLPLGTNEPVTADSVLGARPENLRTLEEEFSDALAGKSELPGQEMFIKLKIDPVVAADLALFQVKRGAGSEKQQNAFIKQFLLKWDGTRAADPKRRSWTKVRLSTRPDSI